ncbi:hypothetical protein ACF3OE_03570 [Capnocytophaga canis]|uniref:hypothetical protein n=1 Tax=Capnocytophaga canis TaxID=1848903 RepID=UPI00370D5FBC
MDRKSFSILVLVLLCTCFIGCLNYHRNSFGGDRPKKPRFRLAKPEPYQLKAEDQIDTTAIYIHKYPDLLDKTKECQMILRFFGNGRFSYIYNDKNYNNLKGHDIGYYRVKNNNIVLMETFIVSTNGLGSKGIGSYSRSVGIIKNDTLIDILTSDISEIEWQDNKIKNKINYVYLKQKVDTLIGTPDW